MGHDPGVLDSCHIQRREPKRLTHNGKSQDVSLLLLKSKKWRHGLFQKIRLVDSRPASPYPVSTSRPASPDSIQSIEPLPSSKSMSTAAHLISALSTNQKGNSVACLGKFTHNLPAMLDQSPALLAIVSCLLDARTRMLSSGGLIRSIDGSLYAHALSCLNSAVQHPDSRSQKTTLYAAAVMQKMETAFVTFPHVNPCRPNWYIHAGGFASLLQALGPFDPDDDDLFYLLLEEADPMTSVAISKGSECFLEHKEWQYIFVHRSHESKYEHAFYQTMAQTARLPGILKDVQNFRCGTYPFENIFNRVQEVTDALRAIEIVVDEFLADRSHVNLCAPSSPTSPVPEVYVFNDAFEAPRLVALHSMLTIIMSGIQLLLIGAPTFRSSTRFEQLCLRMSKRIWMLHELAQELRPFGHYFYITTLMMTFEAAKDDVAEEWILDILRELQVRKHKEPTVWTREIMLARWLILTGRLDSEACGIEILRETTGA